MDYRTKATVGAGIVEDRPLGSAGRLINYQPGNGTRYILLFNQVPAGAASETLGLMGEPGWVVTWIHHRSRSHLVYSQRGFLHWSDAQEWFKTSKSDAVVLAEIIGHVTGIAASTLADARREDLRVLEGGA